MHTPSRLSVLAISILVLLEACGPKGAGPAAPPPLVTVAAPIRAEVHDVMQFDGTVSAYETVNLVARVPGFLQAAPFTEGEAVKKGQLLFVIEPSTYQQQVKLYQAQVDQARAEAERQQKLLEENAISQSSVESAASTLKQAEANLELAKINLGYTQVRAPYDGVIGQRLVDLGNYVGASPGTTLATLVKLRPIYVLFSVNEHDLLQLRARMPPAERGHKPKLGVLPLSATLQGETAPSAQGVLDFIDNTLSTSTGSIQMRGRFPNDDFHLLPGLFAKISINVGPPHEALLVPNVAVQSDQQGDYVFVVDGSGKVARRNVTSGSQYGGNREILQGLTGSDRVVVNGISNVGVGEPVSVQHAPAAGSPALPQAN
jgi:membrane fusion protein, multidrug efflux system